MRLNVSDVAKSYVFAIKMGWLIFIVFHYVSIYFPHAHVSILD